MARPCIRNERQDEIAIRAPDTLFSSRDDEASFRACCSLYLNVELATAATHTQQFVPTSLISADVVHFPATLFEVPDDASHCCLFNSAIRFGATEPAALQKGVRLGLRRAALQTVLNIGSPKQSAHVRCFDPIERADGTGLEEGRDLRKLRSDGLEGPY